jgi:hypothetical protein
MALDRRGPPRRRGTGILGLILAVLVGSSIGAGVLVYVRSTMKKAKPPALDVSATASTSAVPLIASDVPEASAPPVAPPDASEDISIDDDLDAAALAAPDTVDDAAPLAVQRKPRPAPKPSASAAGDEAPPDLPPNPFE